MDTSPLTYTVATGETEGTIIVTLIGPLILYNFFQLQAELRSIDAGVLILDLEQMTYTDSAGLGLIMNAYVSATAKGRRFMLAGVSERVEAMLHLTRVDQLLEIFSGVEEAEDAVARTAEGNRLRAPHNVRIERGPEPGPHDARPPGRQELYRRGHPPRRLPRPSQAGGSSMDKVEISDDQISPLASIAPDLRGLKIAFVNVFAVAHQDNTWTLIDAALPLSAKRIKSWSEGIFGRGPNAIVLTHGHFDHVSAAKELADEWDVPVYAHPLEFPYLTGQKEYPAPDWKAGGGVMPLMSPTLPRGPIDLGTRLRPLPGEGAELSLAELPGWTLLHTPGHTPGHVSFFRKSDRTLLVGDAFCTTKPESFFDANFAQPAELHGPPAYFTSDWGAAKQSVRKLAALQPTTVAPGHGKPLSGAEVPAALDRLAADFERIAVPEDVKRGDPGGDTHL